MKKYQIQNELLQVRANQKGAELANIFSPKKNIEYMWTADPNYWGRHSCILFPIVGKVSNDTYRIGDKTYPLKQHGFARNVDFKLVEHSETKMLFELKSSSESLDIYPYKFRMLVGYELLENQLKITYSVENADAQAIYFSIGGHPGFNCPLLPDEKRSDYSLVFNKKETASRHLLEGGFFNGKTEVVLNNENRIQITDDLFEKDALVFRNMKSNEVSLENGQGEKVLTFNFEGFPDLGIWSKSSDAPFVCIEPWFGLADTVDADWDFREKDGVIKLEERKIFKCVHTVTIH